MIFGSIGKKKITGKSLLDIVEKYNYIGTPNRNEELSKVIELGKEIEEPYGYLAIAMASALIGVNTRKQAIVFFEKYFDNPVEHHFFNYKYVYNTLAKLYEAEYDFENAEKYYILYQDVDCPAKRSGILCPNIPLGNLYLKIGTQKAIDYWNEVKTSNDYKINKEFKRIVDIEYKNAVEKHKNGYVYKPRNKK